MGMKKALGIIIALTILLIINSKMENKFMKECQEKGYSYNYCVEHS